MEALGDAIVGHRLAERAVRNFVTDLVHCLEQDRGGETAAGRSAAADA